MSYSQAVLLIFWKDVDGCVQSFGANVKVVLMGDLNARLRNEKIEGAVGRFGVHGKSKNGERLLGLCVEQEMGQCFAL